MKTRAAIAKDARCLRSGSLSPRKCENIKNERQTKPKKEVSGNARNAVIQQKESPTRDLLPEQGKVPETESSVHCCAVDRNEDSHIESATGKGMVNESGISVAADMIERKSSEDSSLSASSSNAAQTSQTADCSRSKQQNNSAPTVVAAVSGALENTECRNKARDTIAWIYSDDNKPSCSGVHIKLKKATKSKLRITEKVFGVKNQTNTSAPPRRAKVSSAQKIQTKTPSGVGKSSQPRLIPDKCTDSDLVAPTVDQPCNSHHVQEAVSDVPVAVTPVEASTHHVEHVTDDSNTSQNVTVEEAAADSGTDHIKEHVLEPNTEVQDSSSPVEKVVSGGTAVCEAKEGLAEGAAGNVPNSDDVPNEENAKDINSQRDKEHSDAVGYEHSREETAADSDKMALDDNVSDVLEDSVQGLPTVVETVPEQRRRGRRSRRRASGKHNQSSASVSSDSSPASLPNDKNNRTLLQPGPTNTARRRTLPVRRCMTQTSLNSYIARQSNNESSSGSATSGQVYSEDETSSSASLDVPPPPRKKLRVAIEWRSKHALVERRDVATQCTTSDSTTNTWFEFYEAEPKERGKMIKRNHFTQTNAHFIASLDYKKCETHPQHTQKYYCGIPTCSFRGVPSEIIAHFKARHTSYSVLICKLCRKRHESLAVFICHLGNRSCRDPTRKEKEADDSSVSSGGEDIVEVGSDDEEVPETVTTNQTRAATKVTTKEKDVEASSDNEASETFTTNQTGAAAKQMTKYQSAKGSAPLDKSLSYPLEHTLSPLTARSRFIADSLMSQIRTAQDLREVLKLLASHVQRAHTAGHPLDLRTLSRCVFWLCPLVDINFLSTLHNGNIKMGVLRSHPHAVYRKLAHLLDIRGRARLSSLLLHMLKQRKCLTKGLVKSLVPFATTTTTTKGFEPMARDSPVLPENLQASSSPSSALPTATEQSKTPCTSAPRQKECCTIYQPLARENSNVASTVTHSPALLQQQSGEARLPKLAPKILSPYTLQSVIHKFEGSKIKGPLTSRSGAVDRGQPQTPICHVPQQGIKITQFSNSLSSGILIKTSQSSMSISPGYILKSPSSSTPTGYIFSASALSPSPPGGPAAVLPASGSHTGSVSSPQPNILLMRLSAGTQVEIHESTATGKLQQIKSVPSSDLAISPVDSDIPCSPKVTETQSSTAAKASSTNPRNAQTYKDVFQSAFSKAMSCVQRIEPKSLQPESVNTVASPEVPKTDGTAISRTTMPMFSNKFLCECGFEGASKVALEEHIRAQHVADNNGCRICSIHFPVLKQLENHFLKHVKIMSTQWVQKEAPVSTQSKGTGGEGSVPIPGGGASGHKVLPQVAEVRRTVQSSHGGSPSLLQDVDDVQVIEAVPRGQPRGAAGSENTATTPSKRASRPRREKKQSRPSIIDVIDICSDTSDTETPEPAPRESEKERKESEKPFYVTARPDLTGPEALKPFFKCIIQNCTFTATVVKEFAIHLASHPTSDLALLHCLYCGQKFDVINEMVSHMALKHGRRIYQCGRCMYRAVSQPLLMLHLRFLHDGCRPVFYKCDPLDYALDAAPEQLKPVDYCCSVKSCKFTSFSPRRFVQHYKACHGEMIMFPCAHCDKQLGSPDSLVQHLTTHGLNTVQCAYCRHGTGNYREMLEHVCDHHADCELNFHIRTQQEQVKYKEFLSDASNRAIFFPESADEQADNGTKQGEESAKPCPFCEETVSSLSDIMQHCSAEHRIVLPVSTILDLLLKKVTTDASDPVRLGCRFCSFKGTDAEGLKVHTYREFSYAPDSTSSSHSDSSQQDNPAFEQWVQKLVEDSAKIPEKLVNPFPCTQCGEGFPSSDDLRVHLYFHKKYFPYYCGICAESFTTEDEATQHQRTQHKIDASFVVEEVRLASVEQVVDEAIEVQMSTVQDRMQSSQSEHCIWVGCTYRCTETATLLQHMISVHLTKHLVCSSCTFASYSEKVMEWHNKSHLNTSSDHPQTPPPAEVVVEAATHTVPMPKPRGSYKCGYCKFRGDSSISIREHAAIAHRGLPVKLVVPPRPVNDALLPVPCHSAESRAGAVPQSGKKQPSSPKSRSKEPHPSSSSTRAESTRAERTRTGPLPCGKCSFSAPSQRILKVHRCNMHPSESDKPDETRSDGERLQRRSSDTAPFARNALADDTSVSSTTEEMPRKTTTPSQQVPSRFPCKRKSVAGSVVCPEPASSRTRGSTAGGYRCCFCTLQFSCQSTLNHHLKSKHGVYALCDHCGKPCMNKKNVVAHCQKVHPLLPCKFSLMTRINSSSPILDLWVKRWAPAAPQEIVEGFSWYRHPVEPVDVDKILVLATVPGLGTPLRFCASTFFAVHTRKPVVRVRDFTKQL